MGSTRAVRFRLYARGAFRGGVRSIAPTHTPPETRARPRPILAKAPWQLLMAASVIPNPLMHPVGYVYPFGAGSHMGLWAVGPRDSASRSKWFFFFFFFLSQKKGAIPVTGGDTAPVWLPACKGRITDSGGMSRLGETLAAISGRQRRWGEIGENRGKIGIFGVDEGARPWYGPQDGRIARVSVPLNEEQND